MSPTHLDDNRFAAFRAEREQPASIQLSCRGDATSSHATSDGISKAGITSMRKHHSIRRRCEETEGLRQIIDSAEKFCIDEP